VSTEQPPRAYQRLWQTVRQQRVTVALLAGIALSVALIVYVAADGPYAMQAHWIALVPALLGILQYVLRIQATSLRQPTAAIAEELRLTNETLLQQVKDLTNLRDVMLGMGATFNRATILEEITNVITTLLNFDRGLALLFDQERNALTFGAYSHAAPDAESQFLLEQLQLDLESTERDSLLAPWAAGQAVLVDDADKYLDSRLNWLLTTLQLRLFYSIPLKIGTQFKGVLIVDNSPTQVPITLEQRSLLDALGAHIAITLENARLYQLTDDQLNIKVQELEILSRIDRELNYTLSVERVLNLMVDWVLRFTGSHAASVALVDTQAQQLRFVAGYGYELAQWEQITRTPWPMSTGICGRVARQGKAENVPDVSRDPDYAGIMPGTRSQLTVPITREDRVIAVLLLESQELDGFTQANMDFAQRLAARAAAAIDNANLFNETQSERHKLEIILSSIADVVIVVDHDGKLALVNDAARIVFRLPVKETHAGKSFDDVFKESALLPLYQRAVKLKPGLVEELTLPDNHALHVVLAHSEPIGLMIVAHDITPFKETDKLKNELLATTSHDLKNPLATILGYVDLIAMTNRLNPQGQEYMGRVHSAVAHMRQLIDDLLDMARIETGIALRYSDVHLRSLLDTLRVSFTPQLSDKAMTLELDIPTDLPLIPADENRLKQILNNLIGNAIKYTPPEGHVWVRAELSDEYAQIAVQDNGLGIGPEDQAQVFARFYRVRTAATEGIDGTGLGLAIVKSLVELHGGEIGLRSRLGEGSTFYFTLPLKAPEGAIRNGSNGDQPASADQRATAGDAAGS